MLDEQEFELVRGAYLVGMRTVKRARELEGRPLLSTDEAAVLSDVAARYFEITGVSGVDPREILKHRLWLLGPACGKCGKERRSPSAGKCVECGYEGD